MQPLPKGYYAVQSDFETNATDCFTYKGVSYSVTPGENVFASLQEANEAAKEIPEVILEGLSYDRFTTPVVLFSSGRHCIDLFKFNRSVTLLGEGAGINPNISSENPMDPPVLNPARSENESVLYGTYWRGYMDAQDEAKDILMDGFSSEYARFRDKRQDGGMVSVAFKNIVHISPCGNTLYLFEEANKEGTLDRQVFMENIRVKDYDDLDYGGNFLLLNAHKAVLQGICYDTTGQLFGMTNMTRSHATYAANFESSDLVISNSYFRNMEGENGICTGCYDIGDKALHVTVEDSVFVNANRKNEPAIRPHLVNESSSVTITGCTFVDDRMNNGPAVSVFGTGRQVEIKDCRVEGFTKEWGCDPEVPTVAPDFIKNTEDGFVTDTEDSHKVVGTRETDYVSLETFYEGRNVYYGDLHAHTACGGTSDGKYPMSQWPAAMDEIKLDFAAIVDHRQMRGFFLPEWDEEKFIIGTEPGCRFLDLNACRHGQDEVHYNMLFPHKYGLAMVLANFPEYEFRGDELTGFFVYPNFTKERFAELTRYIQSIGGMVVHPHPKTMLSSDDPMDYYFGEHMYLETLYETFGSHASFKNYDLWVALLKLGKHVYTACGSDTHGDVKNTVVATFYTKEKSGRAFFDQMHTADFTAGAVGMKMAVEAPDGQLYPMGSETGYRDGMKLKLRLGDFYEPMWQDETAYELRIYTEKGLVYSSMYNGKETQEITLEVQKRAFYRAEVFDLTHGYRVAVGNPIWLDA